MTLNECVLRAYHFHGGQANNEQVSAYVADRRPESIERLHERLIPNEVQALKRRGFLALAYRATPGEPGAWRLTEAGRQAAQRLVNPN